jgi:hypothetical protein
MARRGSDRAHGAKCTICAHPDRARIDLAIASGVAKRIVAQRFNVSPDAAWRHGRDHLSPELRAALVLKLVAREGDTRAVLLEEGASAVEALRAVRGPLFARFLASVDAGDDRAASALAGRLHEGLALSAKLTGELVPAAGVSVTNVVLHPDYQRLRVDLLRILARHPAAKDEVAAAFRRFGEEAAAEMHRGIPRPMMIEAKAEEVSADAA